MAPSIGVVTAPRYDGVVCGAISIKGAVIAAQHRAGGSVIGPSGRDSGRARRAPSAGRFFQQPSGLLSRNVNPKLRVVSVSPDAAITTLEGTTPVSEDLQALADRAGTPGGEYHPYRITVTDGAIAELTQIYQP